MNNLLLTALELHDAGLSVVPVRADGTKSPAVAWKPYTQTPATRADLQSWFTHDGVGVGCITGRVSGGLELLEIEGAGMEHLPGFHELCDNAGLRGLWEEIPAGWS